jgi:hypothetical protein
MPQLRDHGIQLVATRLGEALASLDIVRDEELMESLRRSRAEAASGQRLRLEDHV